MVFANNLIVASYIEMSSVDRRKMTKNDYGFSKNWLKWLKRASSDQRLALHRKYRTRKLPTDHNNNITASQPATTMRRRVTRQEDDSHKKRQRRASEDVSKMWSGTTHAHRQTVVTSLPPPISFIIYLPASQSDHSQPRPPSHHEAEEEEEEEIASPCERSSNTATANYLLVSRRGLVRGLLNYGLSWCRHAV